MVVFYLFVNVRGVLSSSLRCDEKSSTEYFKPGLYMDLIVVHNHELWQTMLPDAFCLQKIQWKGETLKV